MKTSRTLRIALSGVALAAAAAAVSGTAALAESPTCGDVRDDTWIAPEAVQARIETLGYTIDDMGVSDGNCYEVSGLNVQGESITTYLDPRTGDIVQQDIAR